MHINILGDLLALDFGQNVIYPLYLVFYRETKPQYIVLCPKSSLAAMTKNERQAFRVPLLSPKMRGKGVSQGVRIPRLVLHPASHSNSPQDLVDTPRL